jgi:hypothetical protein
MVIFNYHGVFHLFSEWLYPKTCLQSIQKKTEHILQKKEHMLYLNASKDVIVGDPQDKCWYFNNDKVLTVYILC